MSQSGAKPGGTASAAMPEPGIGTGSEFAAGQRRDAFLRDAGDSFRYASVNMRAYGCGLFSNKMVAVVASAKTRPGQRIVHPPAVAFSTDSIEARGAWPEERSSPVAPPPARVAWFEI